MQNSKKICVIGLGYIGLPTAALLANRGEIHIVEPNISEYSEFEIINYDDALKQADVVTFLVAHKDFRSLEIDLDFCGVRN